MHRGMERGRESLGSSCTYLYEQEPIKAGPGFIRGLFAELRARPENAWEYIQLTDTGWLRALEITSL